MKRKSHEIDLQAALMLKAPKVMPNLRLFRRGVARVRIRDEKSGKHRVIRFGIAGQCDLYGIEKGGKHIEIELKSETGSLSAEQEAWWHFCTTWRVPYLVLAPRRGETVVQTVDRWLREIERELSVSGAPF